MENDQEHELNLIDYTKIEKFSLNNMIFDAKVIKVYDGDTITVVFNYNNKYYKWNCRLNGIDTPEIKSNNEDEKKNAIKARDFLKEQILSRIVKLYCGEFDKYGRLLVNIIYKEKNINEFMILNGYANKYDGGTKLLWN